MHCSNIKGREAMTGRYGMQFLEEGDSQLQHHDILITGDNRQTSTQMTLAEYTRVLEERTKQLQNCLKEPNFRSYVYVDYEDDDLQDIAKKEILEGKCPLMIMRRVGKNAVEMWSVNEMSTPFQ